MPCLFNKKDILFAQQKAILVLYGLYFYSFTQFCLFLWSNAQTDVLHTRHRPVIALISEHDFKKLWLGDYGPFSVIQCLWIHIPLLV